VTYIPAAMSTLTLAITALDSGKFEYARLIIKLFGSPFALVPRDLAMIGSLIIWLRGGLRYLTRLQFQACAWSDFSLDSHLIGV